MRLINHPVLCNYYVTYRCNAACSFCDIWEKPSPYIDLKNARNNLRDLKRLGVKVIDFTGGEPLLHREIDQLLVMAKSMGFITTLTTNGLLYPKKAESLKGNIDMLHFSLDTFDKDQHDSYRGVTCYDAVMNSLQIALELGERPDLLFTVFESNMDQIGQVYRKLCLPYDLMLLLNPVFPYNQVDTGNNLSHASLDRLLKWGRKPNIYLNKGFVTLRKDGGNHVTDPVCKAGSSTVVISPENNLITPCYHLEKASFPIEDNLYALYKSSEVQEMIKKEGRYPECEGCVVNCYMQPSFSVEMNKYWWHALPSTIKYNLKKGTWKNLIKNGANNSN